MPDPTPEERAEALRQRIEQTKTEDMVPASELRGALADLLAAESERAELAREVEITRKEADAWAESLKRLGHEYKTEKDRAERAEREVEELRGALRSLADYGPLEDTIRWNEMDSGHRSALMIARAALSEPTEGE